MIEWGVVDTSGILGPGVFLMSESAARLEADTDDFCVLMKRVDNGRWERA